MFHRVIRQPDDRAAAKVMLARLMLSRLVPVVFDAEGHHYWQSATRVVPMPATRARWASLDRDFEKAT